MVYIRLKSYNVTGGGFGQRLGKTWNQYGSNYACIFDGVSSGGKVYMIITIIITIIITRTRTVITTVLVTMNKNNDQTTTVN